MPWASALAASSAPAGNPGAAAQASAHAAPATMSATTMSECSRAVPVVRWVSSRPWSGPSSQPAGARSVGGESVERRSAAALASHPADPRTPPMPRHAAAAQAARSRPIAGRRRTAVRAGALAMSRRSLRLGKRRVHARLGSALPCSEGLDARPPEWHRGAMRRAAAMATMAFAGIPIACGASTTAVTSSPVASTAAAPCANVAHAELVAVARRIYAQALTAATRSRRSGVSPAPRAWAEPSRPAIRAPSGQRWLHCSSTRSRAST